MSDRNELAELFAESLKNLSQAYDALAAERDALREENARLRENARLEQALQRAAAELPEGFDIRVVVENGAGWVEATDGEGQPVFFEDSDRTLWEGVNSAFDAAIDQARQQGKADGS